MAKLGEGITPGPWRLEAGRHFITSSGEFYITYGKDRHGNSKFKDFCELDANAHLIAHAPLLVEARELIAVIANCEDYGELHMDEIGAKCRTLLAKLEGK